MNHLVRILLLSNLILLTTCSNYWTWNCHEGQCVKTRLSEVPNKFNEPAPKSISPELCELTCNEYSRIWPMPTKLSIIRDLAVIDLEDKYTGSGLESPQLQAMVDRFFRMVSIYNDHNKNTAILPHKTRMHFTISDLSVSKLEFNTDESYLLNISDINGGLHINITSNTIYGARHALETLSQVLVFDEVNKVYVTLKGLVVEDNPKYGYRGLMLDTGRNFITVPMIKQTIEGMAVNKLNTLHWHITDSPSFPYESRSLPELSALGAYSEKHVYTVGDVKEIVDWAAIRGVRIIPEFDGPSHVGEGWQDTGFVKCFSYQPWDYYCDDPPCGQFDPTQDELYSTLRLLYRDMIESFDPVAFHFGDDEVEFVCWKEFQSILDWMQSHNMSTTSENDEGFIKLWNYYQNNTYNIFMEEMEKEIPAILWTSTLTESENLQYLPNDKYIIHVWSKSNDKQTLSKLLANDYKMLFTFHDSMYLDCGFHNYVTGGYNWCSPYNTWKTIYQTSPAEIVANLGADLNKPHLIIGAETALWTEATDDQSLDNRIWPRTSALAERLWAEPKTNWAEAQYRLDSHRQRLIKLGIKADTLIPHWCYLNQDSCTDGQLFH